MEPQRPEDAATRYDALLGLLALAAIVIVLLLPPHNLLDKADHAAFAVCHRISERTFVVAGRSLPLCARCSGTYLGALAGVVTLVARGRGRASRLPTGRFRTVLALFLFAWAADGFNSFLTLFPGAPFLYPPHNLLRLVTGTLEGLAIAAFTLPALNLALWARETGEQAIASWRDLLWLLVAGAAVIGLVSGAWPALLYPLALLSGLMIVGLMGAVNTMLALILLRREGRATGWQTVWGPCALGLTLALGELAAISSARAALTAHFGLPF